MKAVLLLLGLVSHVFALDFSTSVTVHGTPMFCDLTTDSGPQPQMWSAHCYGEVNGHRVATLDLDQGTYQRLGGGSIELRHPYANLVITLAPAGSGFSLSSTNVDIRSVIINRR